MPVNWLPYKLLCCLTNRSHRWQTAIKYPSAVHCGLRMCIMGLKYYLFISKTSKQPTIGNLEPKCWNVKGEVQKKIWNQQFT